MSQAALVNGSRGRNIKESDRRFIRVLIGAHRRLLGVSSGRLLGRMGGHPLLILTTSGRRTGQPYSTPVIGIASGPDWLVVASNGGAATQPLWVRNIEAGPRVTVRRGKRTESFQARILPAEERSQWWPKLVQAYPPYGKMQAKTDRELPVVLLTRTDPGSREPGPGAASLGFAFPLSARTCSGQPVVPLNHCDVGRRGSLDRIHATPAVTAAAAPSVRQAPAPRAQHR